MRTIALLLLGVLLGVATTREEKKPLVLRKARETHRLAVERPRR